MSDNSLVERSRSGGFVLRREEGDALRLTPDGESWVVAGPGPLEGARLARAEAGGFVLSAADGAELGRSSRLAADDARGTSYLLLDDGRLFRIAGRGPGETGLDLCGWETPGAYLTARPEEGGWRIAPTAAGEVLPPTEVLPLLFAAELLDAERPLDEARSR